MSLEFCAEPGFRTDDDGGLKPKFIVTARNRQHGTQVTGDTAALATYAIGQIDQSRADHLHANESR